MSHTSDFDAIVIGAGHNALTCAAYLGKFGGLRVLALEQRDRVGGFASTETPFASHPDVKVSRFGVDHMHMCSGPVPAELGLTSYRPRTAEPFEYLWHDQAHWLYMYPDGKGILAAKDLDATAQRVDDAFPGEGAGYRDFTQTWGRILDVIETVDLNPPSPNGPGALAAWWADCDKLTQFFLSDPLEFIGRYFTTDQMIGMQAWWASQTASPPWQPGSSVLALSLAAATHLTGKARPRGGSGALSATLADMIEHAHGGVVRTNALVTKVMVTSGHVTGVEFLDRDTQTTERVSAPIVISGVDAKRLLTDLVDREHVPPWLAAEVSRIAYSRIGLVKADVVVSRKPDFAGQFGPSPTGNDEDYAIATGIIAPGYETYVKPGWLDILAGKPAGRPALWCVCPTALDPTLAPEGLHTLWLSQFTCKRLAGGARWDQVRKDVGLSMFRAYAHHTGLAESDIVDICVTTPDDMGGLLCTTDPFGVAMNMDQMLSFRPSPHLSRYRTPIRGLYLTGSGVHPGGGITGVPGRNAALEVLADRGVGRTPRRGRLRALRDAWDTYRKLQRLEM